MNAGRALQVCWRWNWRPLRVRIERLFHPKLGKGYTIRWQRWFPRANEWRNYRAYTGFDPLSRVVVNYRNCAAGWRGLED